jgi:hypothetical protein
MAEEDLGLMQSEGESSSGEEALVYISDEKHPTGATKKAETRRERGLCLCVFGVMVGSIVIGVVAAVTLFVAINKGYGNQHSLSADLSVNVTTLERSGDWVLVEWQHVDNPNVSDWIGLYAVPDNFNGDEIDPTQKAPVKFQYANRSQTHMSEGRGSLQFRLVNIRQPLIFGLFRGGLDTSEETVMFWNGSITLAVSEVVRFRNWNEPLQAHLALTGDPTEMIVCWVTNNSKSPEVKLGTKSGDYKDTVKAESRKYSASDMTYVAAKFGYRDPGLLHQAKLTGLQPGLTYYYVCGDENFGWSQEFHFTAASPGDPNATTRVIVYGDMGNGHIDDTWQVIRQQPGARNTTAILKGLVNETDVVFHIGDISYARGYANVWDEFFDEVQPICANVPYMVCIGNHERNWLFDPTSYWRSPDSGGEKGVPYEWRFPMPRPALDQPWYGVDYGSVHFLIMSTEHNFTKGSIQYQYLEKDLRNVNRSKTPWLLIAGHRPMYVYSKNDTDRYAGVQPVAKLLREQLEDLLKKYKVDLALWGHEHTYQRTYPVYKEECVGAGNGTVHVVVGMGGQRHSTGYPETEPKWLDHFDKKYYGLTRITANSTDLVLEYIVSEGGHSKVKDQFKITPWT